MNAQQHILIIEDEEAIRKGLSDTFVFNGYEVVTASRGDEGLELALKEKIDLGDVVGARRAFRADDRRVVHGDRGRSGHRSRELPHGSLLHVYGRARTHRDGDHRGTQQEPRLAVQ